MKPYITPEVKDVMEAIHYRPAISVILPFEPKMTPKAELNTRLEECFRNVDKMVAADYPAEVHRLVMEKLQRLIGSLNFNTYKRSIAFYVSPVFEKLIYLDIPVEEKIIIDESFEIRDLVYSKKQVHKYLVLVLSQQEATIFLGNTETFVRILTRVPEETPGGRHDTPSPVSNFTDKAGGKEVRMEKFLQHIDNALNVILNAYRLPLFVIGTERICGHFGQLTAHSAAVVEYLHGNYDNAGSETLKNVLQPALHDWKKVIQTQMLNRLTEARSHRRLASGIHEVWQEATQKKGKLLVVEKNYRYAAARSDREEVIYDTAGISNTFSLIRDAVDDVIEKVLENGGDVEFVEEGLLDAYEHIALVLYY
ncbi:MAG: hypothetical protein U0X40_06400 [Ferruginibacter sp.]